MSHNRWGRFALVVFGVLVLLLPAALISCGGTAATSSTPPPPPVPLTAADVQQVVEDAALSLNAPMVIAVSDRAGTILALFQNAGAPATSEGNFGVTVDSKELAVALARTAAYFSNDQAPLSSRTVRFISGVHFPPGVVDAPNGDLYGIENTNRGCPLNATFLPGQTINPARSINGLNLGLGIITGKANNTDSDPTAVNPGGVPLFKNGHVVGGVGVVSTSTDAAEFAAFSGASQSGFLPSAVATSAARSRHHRRYCVAVREPDNSPQRHRSWNHGWHVRSRTAEWRTSSRRRSGGNDGWSFWTDSN